MQKNYEPIIDIIHSKLKDRLDSSVHLMAYPLNHYYHYKDSELHLDHDIMIEIIDFCDILFLKNIEMQKHNLKCWVVQV